MPIKFRCEQCESKLSIKTSKAGTEVNCPKCDAAISVPEKSDREFEEVSMAASSKSSTARAGSKASSKPGGIEAEDFKVVGRESDSDPFSEFAVFDEPDVVYAPGVAAPLPSARIDFDRISIPRHIVYTQGALLGLAALFFFSLGIWIGRSTAKPQAAPVLACRVTGEVFYQDDEDRISDNGSVVIFLPTETQPEIRPDPKLLHPGNRLTGDNRSVSIIREFGGDVGSVSPDGEFQVQLSTGKSYYMCVLSSNKRRQSSDEVSKQKRAEMATYFLPVDELVANYEFRWEKVELRGNSKTMETVVF